MGDETTGLRSGDGADFDLDGGHGDRRGEDAPQERAAFGAEVRSYLLENPEVIEEAQAVLEERRAEAERKRDAQLVADNLETLHGDEMSPTLGDPHAPFTIVKFNDFRCGHCRDVEPDLVTFMSANPDYKLIVKELPILGPHSVVAASFAVATYTIGGAEAYNVVKERLFVDEGPKTAEHFRLLASELGIDPDEVTGRMGSLEVRKHLQRNVDLAREMEIRGTPGLVFEDVVVRGRVSLEVMRRIRQHIDTC